MIYLSAPALVIQFRIQLSKQIIVIVELYLYSYFDSAVHLGTKIIVNY